MVHEPTNLKWIVVDLLCVCVCKTIYSCQCSKLGPLHSRAHIHTVLLKGPAITLNFWLYGSALWLHEWCIACHYAHTHTSTAATRREASSKDAEPVDEVKLLAPRCKPRNIRPSSWYCCHGNHTRSTMPWTA